MDPSNAIFSTIDALERATDFLGKHMKKLIFVIVLLYIIVNWNEVSSFVVGNVSVVSTNITKWLVDHTPKK